MGGGLAVRLIPEISGHAQTGEGLMLLSWTLINALNSA